MAEFRAKKEGHWIAPGPYKCEGQKNLQRGTAAAAELGGKAAMCISCERYGGFLCSEQYSFVQDSHA
jgi:hypothetical protein